MKTLLIFLLLTWGALAQSDGPPVQISEGPPPFGWEKILCYDGTCGAAGTNLTAVCYARSSMNSVIRMTSVAISAASNASPVSLTSASHGFAISARPSVTISGGTGNWTPINGTFVAIVTGVNTFTIPVDSSAFGALTGTITFTTTAPRMGNPEWAVEKLVYSSTTLIWSGWLLGSTQVQAKCSDAGLTTVVQQ